MTRQKQFTLIGLAIVVAILGICVPLLVTALATGREAANRASCKGNLFHIRTGMELYVSFYGKSELYPPHLRDDFLNCMRGTCGGSHPEPWTRRRRFPRVTTCSSAPGRGRSGDPASSSTAGPSRVMA
jgi:hypothetical protein